MIEFDLVTDGIAILGKGENLDTVRSKLVEMASGEETEEFGKTVGLKAYNKILGFLDGNDSTS